ncbi:hypothetical protein L195_g064479, partial [Trifolium pratense]
GRQVCGESKKEAETGHSRVNYAGGVALPRAA